MCSTYWDQHEQTGPPAYGKTSFPTAGCGYTAKQLHTAYRMQPSVRRGDTGAGVTVAHHRRLCLADDAVYANALAASQGEPQFKAGQYTHTTFSPFSLQDLCGGEGQPECGGEPGRGGGACPFPGANIHYIGAQNCDTGIDAAANYVIQNHVADIVSNSYGFIGEAGLGTPRFAPENSMFIQAAAEGIGFYFATGDYGDNVVLGTPHPGPDFPTSDPWVTAVGGTSLAVKASGAYQFETACAGR